MTTTTALNLDQGVFDSSETETLSLAFEKAAAFVEFDPMLGVFEASEKIPTGTLFYVTPEAWRNRFNVACKFRDKNAA